jgi:hypothetical protein
MAMQSMIRAMDLLKIQYSDSRNSVSSEWNPWWGEQVNLSIFVGKCRADT